MTPDEETARLKNPRLHEAIQRDTAKTFPPGSRLFWKKTLEDYQRRGGTLEQNEETEP